MLLIIIIIYLLIYFSTKSGHFHTLSLSPIAIMGTTTKK